MASLPPHPINGTEQYLEAVLEELQGLRADLAIERAERAKAIARQEMQAAAQPIINNAATIPDVDPTTTVELKEPQAISLENPTGGATVRVPMGNLPPLSDEAGNAMARALDDGRPKTKTNYRKKAAD